MDKNRNIGNFEVRFESIQPTDCHAIQALLNTHFYPSSLGYKRSYPLFVLHQVLAEGSTYGVKVTESGTKKLLGVILARSLGSLQHFGNGKTQASLVSDLCLVPEARGNHFTDHLLNCLYQVSSKRNIFVHFFQVDQWFLVPWLVQPLNTKSVYRLTNPKELTEQLKPRQYTQQDFRKASLVPLPEFRNNPIYIEPSSTIANPFIEVYEDPEQGITAVLRALPELNQRNEEGAEVIYVLSDQTKGKKAKLEDLLAKTKYGWFESMMPYSASWTKVGSTITYAFHLNYGNPAEHDVFFL